MIYNSKSIFLTVFVLLFSFQSFAQKKQYVFSDEFCTFTGIYDSKKYTEVQLKNTYAYLYSSHYISTPVTAWKFEEIDQLSQAKLKEECSTRIKELKNNKFVETDFWKQAKQNRLREIEETCALKAITIAGYKNPDTLKAFKKTDKLSLYYRDALIAGGDQMLEAWKVLNEEIKSKNGYPDEVQKKFEQQYNSPERLEFARIEIMSFGWWNNSNHLLFRSEETVNYFREFEKLFISLKSECADAD